MKTKWKIVYFVMILLFFVCLGSLYISKHFLTVTHYEVSAKNLHNAIRILQVTDLHNSQFGDHNEKLIEMTAEQEPDLIVLTGDLVNSDEQDISIAQELVCALSKIAPVYASYGNHELQHEEKFGSDLAAAFEEAGATSLEFAYEDIEVNGEKIRIGGLYGYCVPSYYNDVAREHETAFLEEFISTDAYKLLLTHMPYCWIANDGISAWDVDCVFTGHDHGGLIRIPFLGGLYAPDQGWFPGKDCGLYYSKDGEKVMVLSRGLGKSGKVPRFNNVPEIVVVDLLSE